MEEKENVVVEQKVVEEVKPERARGLGIAGMVIGIVALVLFWTGPIALVSAVAGLILAIIHKAKGGRRISGIILNAITIFLAIVSTVVYFACIYVASTSVVKEVLTNPEIRHEAKNAITDVEESEELEEAKSQIKEQIETRLTEEEQEQLKKVANEALDGVDNAIDEIKDIFN